MSEQIVVGGTSYRPVPLEFDRVEPGEARRESLAFLELMERRRSVRHFSTEAVAWELVENALRTAGTAPSGANQQPCTVSKGWRVDGHRSRTTVARVGSEYLRPGAE